MRVKKKILFIVDYPDWAFHNMIKEVILNLDNEYEFYWDFSSLFSYVKTEYKVNTIKAILFNLINSIKLLSSKLNIFISFNIVYFLSLKENSISSYISENCNNFYFNKVFYKRKILRYNENYDLIFHMDYYYQYCTNKLPHQVKDNNYIVGIYTEGFPHNGLNYDHKANIDISRITQDKFFEKYIKKYKALIVGSENLLNQYSTYNIPKYFCTAIYRESEFEIFEQSKFFNEYLIIGWTGNPSREFKGFENIIKPAIEKVRNSGRKVILKTQFSGTYTELIDFYKDVSLCLIASSADTGPSMFAESSLSGIPCISTKIGFPNMVIIDGENGYLVERNIDSFYNKICFCYDNREVLAQFSKRIRSDYMQKLGNNILMNNWRKVIQETLLK